MSDRNPGLQADPLFVGLTRPPMRFGVTFTGLMGNALFTMMVFVLTKDLRTLALALPIHGICLLLCTKDARYFDLLVLWLVARAPALLGTLRFFGASSAGALRYEGWPSRSRHGEPPQVRL